MQSAVGAEPEAAVARRQERIDAVQPSAHHGPVSAIKRPDPVLGGGPDPAVGGLGEADYGLRRASIGRGKDSPLLVVVPGCATIAAHPQVAILGGEQAAEIAAGR